MTLTLQKAEDGAEAGCCPRCQSSHTVKNGSVKGKAKRRCRDCGYSFSRLTPRGKPVGVKIAAIMLYVHGLSMNVIARFMGVSNVAVLKWIRAFGQKQAVRPPAGEAVIIELDEMWHYLQKKQKNSGSGKRSAAKAVVLSTGNVELAMWRRSSD
jgi:transposase-like protein